MIPRDALLIAPGVYILPTLRGLYPQSPAFAALAQGQGERDGVRYIFQVVIRNRVSP